MLSVTFGFQVEGVMPLNELEGLEEKLQETVESYMRNLQWKSWTEILGYRGNLGRPPVTYKSPRANQLTNKIKTIEEQIEDRKEVIAYDVWHSWPNKPSRFCQVCGEVIAYEGQTIQEWRVIRRHESCPKRINPQFQHCRGCGVAQEREEYLNTLADYDRENGRIRWASWQLCQGCSHIHKARFADYSKYLGYVQRACIVDQIYQELLAQKRQQEAEWQDERIRIAKAKYK